MLLFSDTQILPDQEQVFRLLVCVWVLHEFERGFPDARYELEDVFVGKGGNLSQRLDGVRLDLFILDLDRSEEPLHDEVSLLLVHEVGTRLLNGPLQRLD